MRVTSKGQVTIPLEVRNALKIGAYSEVDFKKQPDGSYILIKKEESNPLKGKFSRLRGIATVKMSTDEIMALLRGE